MISTVARREVTLREWWEMRRDGWAADGHDPVLLQTVQFARKMHRHDFPAPAKMVGRTAVYYLTDLDAWKRDHPGMFRGIPR